MKNLFILFALVFAFAFTTNAQTATSSQTANAGFVGYSFNRSDINSVTVNSQTFHFNDATDTNGVNVSATHFFGGTATKAGTVGLTADLGANFGSGSNNLVTVMGGVTAQARNYSYVQPYVRALAGVGRQNVDFGNIQNLGNTSSWSGAYALGGGFDFNLRKFSRYKLRLGADYLNTGFHGERQNNVRLTTGIVF